jgi:hypothetical protein
LATTGSIVTTVPALKSVRPFFVLIGQVLMRVLRFDAALSLPGGLELSAIMSDNS